MDFKQINTWSPEPGIRKIKHDCEAEIRNLLIGRRIVKVIDDHCLLDDGTVLAVIANEGCGGCPSGHYELDHLATVDNAITDVQFNVEDQPGSEYSEKLTYKVFVFADASWINLFSVSGDDGNGYYGTGYHILVRLADSKEH